MVEEEALDSFTLISTAEDGSGTLVDKLKKGKEWIQTTQAITKPWSEFFNVRRVKKPSSAGDATNRLVSNIRLYHMNYLFIFMGLAVYCVVTNPILLFALAFCAATYWFVSVKNKGNGVSIVGREFTPAEIYTLLGVICVPVFYIAGAGSTIFWIIGASVVITLIHSIIMAPPTSSQPGSDELGIVMEDVTVD